MEDKYLRYSNLAKSTLVGFFLIVFQSRTLAMSVALPSYRFDVFTLEANFEHEYVSTIKLARLCQLNSHNCNFFILHKKIGENYFCHSTLDWKSKEILNPELSSVLESYYIDKARIFWINIDGNRLDTKLPIDMGLIFNSIHWYFGGPAAVIFEFDSKNTYFKLNKNTIEQNRTLYSSIKSDCNFFKKLAPGPVQFE